MFAFIAVAAVLLALGFPVGRAVRWPLALLYPALVAAIVAALVLSGALFGASSDVGVGGSLVLAILWTALPAAIGTALGIGVGRNAPG